MSCSILGLSAGSEATSAKRWRQEPRCLSEIRGPRGFSDRLSVLVVLDPEERTEGPAVDRSLSPTTSVLIFHKIVSLVTVGGAVGLLLESGVWAHYGHTEWPDPHQLWGKTQRGGLDIRRVLLPLLRNGAELAPPNMASGVIQRELQRSGKDGVVQMRWCSGGGEVRSCRG